MNKVAQIGRLISTDFPAFCKVCLTLPAKNFKLPPTATTIQPTPFALTEHQLRFVEYLNKPYTDKTILKTRQRGYSSLLLAYCLWLILYHRNQNILYIIDKEAKANEFRRLLNELFHSIPLIYRPKGIAIMASNEIYNHRLNNHLSLKTASSSVGRSGTYSLSICDEYAYYDAAIQQDIAASLTSSCQSRIWLSTPKREQDEYHHKVLKAENDGTLWKHTYWEYTEDWFGSQANAGLWRKEQEKGLNQHQIARELDCAFKGAAQDLIWFVPNTTYRINNFTPNNRVLVSLDVGYSPDPTAVLYAIDTKQTLHIIDEALYHSSTIPSITTQIKAKYNRFKYGVVDSAALKTDQTSGVSIHADLQRRLGCKFFTGKPRQEEGIQLAQSAILDGRLYISPNCAFLIEMFNNYEWENEKPPKNKYKHIHDAFCYLVYNWLKVNSIKHTPPRLIPRHSISSLI